MKITILGAGVCASHFIDEPGQNIYPPAFLVQWGNGESLMFECGQGVQQRLEENGHDYASVRHIAVSHPHPDHYAPAHFFQSVFCKGIWGGERFTAEEIHLYGPDATIADFPALWKIHFPETNGAYFDHPRPVLHPMTSDRERRIGSAALKAMPVHHGGGRCEALCYRLETPEGVVAYSGDTGDCEGVREIARNADIFICECSARVGDRESSRGYGHLDPRTVGEIAGEAQVKTLALFHYTGLDKEDALAQEIRRGYQGKIIFGKDSSIIEQ